jgi:hypothetical protein
MIVLVVRTSPRKQDAGAHGLTAKLQRMAATSRWDEA